VTASPGTVLNEARRSAPWALVLTLVVSLAILVSALIWPSYHWSPRMAGLILGGLAAVVAYLGLIPGTAHPSVGNPNVSLPGIRSRQQQSTSGPSGVGGINPAEVQTHWLWATSLITAIATATLVVVERTTSVPGTGAGQPVAQVAESAWQPVLVALIGIAIAGAVVAIFAWALDHKSAAAAGVGVTTASLLVAFTLKVVPTIDAKLEVAITPPATASPSVPHTAPKAPRKPVAAPDDRQATVYWTAPSAGGSAISDYFVTSSPGNVTIAVPGNVTSASVTGLTNGISYQFSVTAANANGPSDPSELSDPVTPATVPGPPTAITVSAGDSQASLKWVPPSTDGGASISGYTITAVTGGVPVNSADVGTGATSFTFNGLTNGAVYWFAVSAYNSRGSGPPATSNPVTPHRPIDP
jgi:fibronectin type III domain protein